MSAGCLVNMTMMSVDQTGPKAAVNKLIWENTQGIVQSGPFKGMQLLDKESWPDGNLGTMVLGCYEAELHQDIERSIGFLSMLRTPPRIANIGCAEGYYAVGMGRRVPKAKIWIVDVNDKALAIAHETAQANGVELISGDLISNVFAEPDLIIMDCEGSEVEYLDIEKYPALAHAKIIVECHDTPENQCGWILFNRFKPTHSVSVLFESGRNPNEFRFLWPRSSIERWLAVSENRPCLMNWLVMEPHSPQVHLEEANEATAA
jgi:hypothetical protein